MDRTRSLRGVCRGVLALTALCTALAFVPGPVQARHPNLELDNLDEGTLDDLLQAELDDDDLIACGLRDPNGDATVEQLFRVAMCALGDGGDSGNERSLDLDDLEFEMAEAGTTVSAVVWAAIEEADEMTSGLPAAGIIRVAFRTGGSEPAATAGRGDGERYAWGNKRVRPANAMDGPIKQGLIGTIQAVRR